MKTKQKDGNKSYENVRNRHCTKTIFYEGFSEDFFTFTEEILNEKLHFW